MARADQLEEDPGEDELQGESEEGQDEGELEVSDEPEEGEQGEEEPAEGEEGEEPAEAEPAERQRTVPHAALHEERERRKTVERTLQDLNSRHTQLEQRTNLLLERLTRPQTQQQQEQIPDRVTQPFEYMEYLERRLHSVETGIQQNQQQNQQQSRAQQILSDGNDQAIAYAQTVPDYQDAFNYVWNLRVNQLKGMGYDDSEIPGMVTRERDAGILAAVSRGKNPGEVLYSYAKASGYKGAPPKPKEKLARVAEGQKRAKSLGPSGGSRQTGVVDAGAISRMTDDEFERWYGKNGTKGLEKLMGG
jgi:hypothetical protein